MRQRAVNVPDTAERVASFHRETVKALAELLAAAGLEHPRELGPHHFMRRAEGGRIMTFAERYTFLKPGELLSGAPGTLFAEPWALARSDSFSPLDPLKLAAE